MSDFTCIPSIDLLGGRCVRLLNGDFAERTFYGDPLELAMTYERDGATLLHVVDLDAARTGERVNRTVVSAIVASLSIPVQLGGGIRDTARAEEVLASGVERIVLGTAALEDNGLVEELAERHPGRVVVGLDHRRSVDSAPDGGLRRLVALRGWEQESAVELEEALAFFSAMPIAAVVVTDIGRDGTLTGSDLEGYAACLSSSSLPLIASGGVGELSDLEALATLSVNGRRLDGVVVGRALLAGHFTLAEAVAACAR